METLRAWMVREGKRREASYIFQIVTSIERMWTVMAQMTTKAWIVFH